MKKPSVATLLALLVSPRKVSAFISARPARLHESLATTQFRIESTAAVDGEESGAPIPGRRIPRFLDFLFDDTIRLLNPKSMASFQMDRKKQYGSSIFRTRIFFRPTLFCTDVESMQQLAQEESKAKLAAFFPPHHQKLFGKRSVLVVSGAQHQRIRQLLQTALAPSVLQQYQGLIEDSVKEFLEGLTKEQGYVEVVPKIRAFFIALTMRVVLGAGSDRAQEEALARDLTIWSRGLISAPLTFIPWSAAAKAMRARSRVVDRLQGIIDKEQTRTDPSDGLLAKLLQAKDSNDATKCLTSEDIIDNVLSLVFAGSDTTASAAASLWMTFPDKSSTSEYTMEELVDRTLHAFPPAPFSMRQIVDPKGINVGGYHVPRNYLVVYGVAGAALDAEDDAKTGSSNNVPFGVGPRMCPGRYLAKMELQATGEQLRHFEWKLDPSQILEQRYTPGFFPKDGLRLQIQGKADRG